MHVLSGDLSIYVFPPGAFCGPLAGGADDHERVSLSRHAPDERMMIID